MVFYQMDGKGLPNIYIQNSLFFVLKKMNRMILVMIGSQQVKMLIHVYM